MISKRKIPTVFIAILLAVFVLFFVWAVSIEWSHFFPTPVAATATLPGLRVTIPQKALWRNYVTVSAEAGPGTKCELTYISPSGDVLQMDITADTTGSCVWRWKIEPSQGKGAGRLIFTINGIGETHFFEILENF